MILWAKRAKKGALSTICLLFNFLPVIDYCRLIQKSIRHDACSLFAALMKEVEEAKDKLKKSIEAGNIEDIKKDSEALEQPLHKLAEQMYAAAQQAQQAAGGAEQGQQQTKSDDNVVDADYTVVDDDKK